MVDNIPEHRTAKMSDDILIKHVRGQLRFVRKGYGFGNYSPAVYRASRRHLLNELRILREQLVPGLTPEQDYKVLVDHQKRIDEFAESKVWEGDDR